MNADQKYAELITEVLAGPVIDTRNSPARRAICRTVEFDSVPLVTTRRTAWRNALREMEWFLSGSSDISDLHPDVRKWWGPWGNERGRVLFNYGFQFRAAPMSSGEQFDQVSWLVDAVTKHPFSRRNCITTWNTGDMQDPNTPITNCHGSWIQVFGRPNDEPDPSTHLKCVPIIDLWMVQRSCDLILGVPHNWVQYWAFLLWLAHRTGTQPGKFIWTGGDVHVYAEHELVAREIVANKDSAYVTPHMTYSPTSDEFRADDFNMLNVPLAVVTAPVRMIV